MIKTAVDGEIKLFAGLKDAPIIAPKKAAVIVSKVLKHILKNLLFILILCLLFLLNLLVYQNLL
mgnify:CR=1 FL=1